MGAALSNIYAKSLRPKAFGPHGTPAELEAAILAWLTDPDNGEATVIYVDYAVGSEGYSALLLYSR